MTAGAESKTVSAQKETENEKSFKPAAHKNAEAAGVRIAGEARSGRYRNSIRQTSVRKDESPAESLLTQGATVEKQHLPEDEIPE